MCGTIMAASFVVGLLLFVLSMAAQSGANYCVCNSGVSDSVLQKNIDYSCANGADCSAIQPNGVCFNPNTLKDHCSYAVNSYYQRKQQMTGSCDFQGTAIVTPNPPNTASGCVFQSGPSTGGGGTTPTTPSTTPPTAGTPATGGTPPNTGNGTPATGGAPPNTGNGTPATGGTIISPPGMGGFSPPNIGLAPAGSGLGNPDGSGSRMGLLPPFSTSVCLLTLSFSFFISI